MKLYKIYIEGQTRPYETVNKAICDDIRQTAFNARRSFRVVEQKLTALTKKGF